MLPLLCRSHEEASDKPERIVVLLELKGGNDGLNTVIPYRDPAYQRARPRLAIREGPLLGEDLMLHPALASLMPVLKASRMAFVLGVGWPQPNRSHFKAMDQWATGSASGEGPGWFAAALARKRRSRTLVALGPSGSPALEGSDGLSVQMQPVWQHNPHAGKTRLPAVDPELAGDNAMLRSMLELEASGQAEVLRLLDSLGDLPQGLTIPRGSLGAQVAMALRLIGAPSPPAVIGLEHSGFDTHSQQIPRHNQLLIELADALVCFDAGLRRMNHRPKVALLAISEFGRRLNQNASGGTDHGSASVALLMGDHLPGRIVGRYPSLGDLDARGDLIPHVKPTDLYESAMTSWERLGGLMVL
ncbi:Twin-arginine translocation pathway signal sequence domain protein [Cyanobium sp. NIES-981]|nr:Twin-arginine translocation pathway signal sequence domain protein [Cyanobium sp. NIES-981]